VLLSGIDPVIGGRVVDNPAGIDPQQWGVIGIAGGTAISYLFGAAMTLWVLRRGVKDLRLEAPDLAPDRAMMWRIVRIGVPSFFEGVLLWGVNLFVLQFIGQIAQRMAASGGSADGLQGAHIIAVQWEAFSFLPGFAMGIAAGALAGQYLGAGNPAKARRAIVACTLVGCAIMGVFGVLFMTEGARLTAIISREPVHLQHVPNMLFICGIVQVFFALTLVIRQGLRGVGDTRWPLIITIISCYGLRLPAAWLLGVAMGYGIEGVWIGLCGELVVRGLLFLGRFVHGGWKHIRV
jgi:Na+-driven multidrug efflux pump